MSKPYIPKLKAYVDWDGDGFVNKGVPIGTPVNLVPYAAFPRACNLKKFDGSYSNRFLFDDRFALVAREISLVAGELGYFGADYPSYWRPTETPNLLDSTDRTPLTITDGTGYGLIADSEGFLSTEQTTSWLGTAYLGGSGLVGAEIPVTNGQAYTFFYYRNTPRDGTNQASIAIRDSANTTVASSSVTNQSTAAWVAINFTAGANPIKIQFGNITDLSLTKFMLLEGTHAAPPDDFNLWTVTAPRYQTPIVMEAGKQYAVSFVLKSDVDCDLDLTIWGQHFGEVGNDIIHSGIKTLTANQDLRVQFVTDTLAQATVAIAQFTTDVDATISLRGYQIAESSVPITFSVGEFAAYDDLTKAGNVLALKWDYGRRKFTETIGYEGTAEITLYNRNKMYSPKNAESPIYGAFRKNLLAYIEVEHPDTLVMHRLFTGWTELFDVVVGTQSNQQARLTLRQGMFRLREGAFAPVVYESQTINDVLPVLIEMAGWRYASHPAQAVLDYECRLGYNAFLPSNTNVYEREESSLYTYDLIGQGWDDDTKISEALEDLLEAEGASFWLGREGKLNFVARTFYLHRPEAIDYSLNLDTVQDGTYEYGRDVASVVSVFAKPKDTAKSQTIWTSKPAIEVNSGETVRIQMNFAFEGGEPRTVTAVDEDIVLTGYYHTKDRNTNPTEISTADLELMSAVVKTDYQGRYFLELTNNSPSRVWLTAEVKGDYVIGGEGVTYEFTDTDAMLAANGIHRRKLTTFLLTSSEEAEGLAQTVFLRDGSPEGEFTSFTVQSRDKSSVESLILMQAGDRIYLKESQTVEVQKPHVILGEEGSFDGRLLSIKYNIGRLDNTIYGKTGDTIEHELTDVMEGEREFYGRGSVEYIYRIEVDELIPLVTQRSGARGFYAVGNEKKLKMVNYKLQGGETEPLIKVSSNNSSFLAVKGGRPYKFIGYASGIGVGSSFSVANMWRSGGYPILPATPQGNSGFSATEMIRGYFTANYSVIQGQQHMAVIGIDGNVGTPYSFECWERNPLTYLKPSTQYTLHVAVRQTENFADRAMRARVIEVQDVAGDGDNTLATASFTSEYQSIGFHSVTFTTPATSSPVRLELEYATNAAYARSYELFEFALVEGAVAPTELGTLTTKNPNAIRLAV